MTACQKHWFKAHRMIMGAVLGLAAIAGALTVEAAPLPSRSTPAINRQLAIPLNNGTLNRHRVNADDLLQQGIDQEAQGLLPEAIATWTDALSSYRAVGDTQAEALVQGYLGAGYLTLGQYPAADGAYRRKAAIASDRRDIQQQIEALNELARVWLQQGNLSVAKPLLMEALTLATRINSPSGLAFTRTGLGYVAAVQGNYPQALVEYDAALAASHRTKDLRDEATVLNSMGDVHRAQQNTSISVRFHRLALNTSRQQGDFPNQYRALDGMAIALRAANQPEDVMAILNQRLQLAQQQPNPRQELISLQSLANLSVFQGQRGQAEQFYQQAIAVARNLKDSEQEMLLLERLANFQPQ